MTVTLKKKQDNMTNQKKALVDVVLRLFEEQGSEFKMDDVAKALKISKKTIYKEYGNKEALIILIVEATAKGIEHHVSEILEDDSISTLEKLIQLNYAFPDARDVNYHKAIMIKDDFPAAYEMFIHYIEDNWALNRRLFNQAISENAIEAVDFDIYKTIILGTTKQILNGEYEDREKQLELCIRQIFSGIICR